MTHLEDIADKELRDKVIEVFFYSNSSIFLHIHVYQFDCRS